MSKYIAFLLSQPKTKRNKTKEIGATIEQRICSDWLKQVTHCHRSPNVCFQVLFFTLLEWESRDLGDEVASSGFHEHKRKNKVMNETSAKSFKHWALY